MLVGLGIVSMSRLPIDAFPDTTPVQVQINTVAPSLNPLEIEQQITLPVERQMNGVPKQTAVRSTSIAGLSVVTIIFEDGTDLYWARSRVLEYLNSVASRLPEGVTPALGPDATGVGWVYQYVLQARDRSLGELRAIQDWFVRYQLAKTPGVADDVGGCAGGRQPGGLQLLLTGLDGDEVESGLDALVEVELSVVTFATGTRMFGLWSVFAA